MTNAERSGMPDCACVPVLVVKDESLVAMMRCDMLEDLGRVVVGPTATVTGALALLKAGAPLDLALLDDNLGGENAYGRAVGQALRPAAEARL